MELYHRTGTGNNCSVCRITTEARHYEAWKLKGEAINYQITATNPRILEVYNCIMTAYRVPCDDLDDTGKLIRKMEIVSSLKDCLEGEVAFWVGQFEANRPTESALNKVKSTFVDCYGKMKAAYEEMDLESKEYLQNFTIYFCYKCNGTCVSAWETTVAYNYFRDDLSNLGRYWNRGNGKEYGTDYFRPNTEIFRTFLSETDNMINLLEYCLDLHNGLDSSLFEGTDPLVLKKNICSNIAYFYNVSKDQCSYKAMVSTTTNGYGAVTDRYEYYEVDRFLTDSAKRIRSSEADKYSAMEEAALKEIARIEEQEKQKKIEAYWAEHAGEKAALEAEKKELSYEIAALKEEIEQIPERPQLNNLNMEIERLTAEKNALGLFKFKEKKLVQEQIDAVTAQKDNVFEIVKAQERVIQGKIDDLDDRLEEIVEELTKER